MFHVYYVNDGCMLLPQTSGIGGRVLDLQQGIRELTRIDVLDQVLYLSSGEQVHSDAPLSAYAHVGTETAPFYLLRRYTRFDAPTYAPPLPERDDLELRHRSTFEFAPPEYEMPPVFQEHLRLFQAWLQHLNAVQSERGSSGTTVNEFLRLWQYGQQLDERVYRTVTKYVEDHTYLYQGWQAVMKNLIESTARMQKLVERSARNAERLETMRERGIADLTDFDDVLKTLAKIMVPSHLLGPAFRSPANNTSATASSSSAGSASSCEEVSLYDWIASTDTTYSPSEMIAYLIDDLQSTDDADLRVAQEHINFVNSILADDRHRHIGGVEGRIVGMTDKRRRIEAKHYESTEITDQMLKEVATTAISYHRRRLAEFSAVLEEELLLTQNIIRSKQELMHNISLRVSNWIQKCYEKLGATRKCLMIFEGKFNGLRDRLRLVRQIREAPILYVTAVAEVIRREALQKEFHTWITSFIERCEKFIEDENKVRSEFYAKLGEHFLRNIFFDLSDQMPDFRPQYTPFDRALPRVTISHLRELRKTFPEMHELLNVTRPRVYERLSITDPEATPQPQLQQTQTVPLTTTAGTATTSAQSQSTAPLAQEQGSTVAIPLKREESFFVREPTANIATINQNFPTQNWLSEEHIDMSPASQLFIATRAAGLSGSNSNASLHVDTTSLASPSDLGPLSDFTLSGYGPRASTSTDAPKRPGGSDPISIGGDTPSAGVFGSDENGNATTIVMDVSTSTVRQLPSPFGTPDSNSDGPTVSVARPTTLLRSGADDAADALAERMSNSLEIFSPSEISELIRAKCSDVSTTVHDISKFLADLRASILALQSEMNTKKDVDIQAFHDLLDQHTRRIDEIQRDRLTESKAENERQMKELRDIVEHERYLRKEKEKELDEQRRVAEKLNEDLLALMKAKDNLNAALIKADQEQQRLRELLDAEASMDYLQIELKAVEQLLKRELTNDEVNEIKREIEKRKISKSEASSLNSEAATAPSPLSIQNNANVSGGTSTPSPQQVSCEFTSKKRSEYEKAFRSKMELIVRGVEEKKNKEMAAQRDEIETEMRKEADAFTRRLKDRIAELEERLNFFEHVDDERRKRDATAKSTADANLQVTLPEDEATVDKIKSEEQAAEIQESVSPNTDQKKDVTTPVVLMSTNERMSQTRIRGYEMDFMISLRNIHEGCSVLVMWNATHNAYVIFSTSPQLYIVREPSNSVRNLDPSKRRNWMFVTVVDMEVCQIRKVENRYNLPVNTRFYWVTVVPLELERSSSATSAPSTPMTQSAQMSASVASTSTASLEASQDFSEQCIKDNAEQR